MKAYIINVGQGHKALNMNDEGKISLRGVEDNIWEQWTFDINGTGHISNVAIDYKVLDASDNGKVKADDGDPDNPYQDWKFIPVENKNNTYNIIHVHDGRYMDANSDESIVVSKHNDTNPYQEWEIVPA